MGSERCIRIGEPKLFDNKTVQFDVDYSRQIRKYFSSDKFYLEYGEDISGLDASILYVPAVSGVIAVAWAIGADVQVETLDQTYLQSLNTIKTPMKQLFPDFSFSTEIEVGDVISNSFSNSRSGLLFTGGVDSVTSYIKHKQERPDLIKVWGVEIPYDDQKNWRKARKIVADFADREEARLHVIRTNIPRVLKKHVLYQKFGLDWWLKVNHGIVLAGLCAPLTCAAGIGTLYIASGNPSQRFRTRLWNSVYNNITWADTQVTRDNFEISRQQKIKDFLKDYVRDNSSVFLKVCNALPASNCGKCEKCFRTIIGLVVEGIDPNKCGFNNINDRTFSLIKKGFADRNLLAKKWIVEKRTDLLDRVSISLFWEDIQKHIPEATEDSPQYSKEFLEWFRTFNIPEYMQETQKNIRVPLNSFMYMLILKISSRMPKSTQNVIKQLLDFFVRL